MSDSDPNSQKKQYSIIRYSRIGDMTTLRHVSNHNTRAVVSENVQRDGPAPIELLEDGDPDITIAARQRAKELGLDLSAAVREGKVIAVEVFMGASPKFFEQASPAQVEDWYRSSTAFMQRRFGRALISVMKHEDEKTLHLQAVSLAAVEKKVGVKGRPPKDAERRRIYDEKVAAMPEHWTFSYSDLLGGIASRLSDEQDNYNACVKHLGLKRGERQKEVVDLVLDDGVVVAAARVSRGKRKDGTDRPARHFTTQEYQAETRRDRAKSAQQQRDAAQALGRAEASERAAEADRVAAADDRTLAAGSRVVAEALQADVIATSADVERRAAAMADNEVGLAHRIADVDLRESALATNEGEIAASRLKAKEDEAAATAARADADRLADEYRRSEAAARVARDRAVRDAAAAEEERKETVRAREAVASEQACIDERQREAERTRVLEVEQLALLARASAEEKLGLQEMDDSFWMNEQAMSEDEQIAYRRNWAAPLIAMARHLARALEKVRAIARGLYAREAQIAASEAAIAIRDAHAARQLAAQEEAQRLRHEARTAELDARDLELANEAARVRQEAADAGALVAAANGAKATADATLAGIEQWTKVLDALARFPGILGYDETGAITLDRTLTLPAWFVTTVDTAPPTWVTTTLAARHRADTAGERALKQEQAAADTAMELNNLVARARTALTPAQEALVVEIRQATGRLGAIIQRDSGRGD